MKWRQVDKHWAVSECGYYTATVSRLGDEPVYLAWYRIGGVPSSQSGKPPDLLGRSDSMRGAARLCTNHESKTRPQAA